MHTQSRKHISSIELWRNILFAGEVDPNVVQNIKNARKAGFNIKDIDVYMDPCFKCPNQGAADQVKEMGKYTGKNTHCINTHHW